MAPNRRVPVGNKVDFIDVTPRGFVDVKNTREFMERCPLDFPEALKRANETKGEKFLALRVPVPKHLARAKESEKFKEASRMAFEAYKLGRVDRIEGAPEPKAETFIYLIQPELNVADRRGLLPCPKGFLEATPEGFRKVNSREFMKEAPPEFVEAYRKAEKEHPGQIIAMRHPPMPAGMSKAEQHEFALETTFQAWQINPPMGGRVDRKEDLAKILKNDEMFSSEIRPVPVVDFVDVTPRGLVDVKNTREFMERCPPYFPKMLENRKKTAMHGEHLFAVRVPMPKRLANASDSNQLRKAADMAYDAYHRGRVDRIEGAPEPQVENTVYIMLSDKMMGVKPKDKRRLLPCPKGFLEATPEGFQGGDDIAGSSETNAAAGDSNCKDEKGVGGGRYNPFS